MTTFYFDRYIAMFTFDDGNPSDYTVAYPLLKSYGACGNLMVIPEYIGTGGYMSIAQITEMYNDGWDICNHADYESVISEADMETKIVLGQNSLIGWGLTRTAKFCKPHFDAGALEADYVTALTNCGVRVRMNGGTFYNPQSQSAPFLTQCNSSTDIDATKASIQTAIAHSPNSYGAILDYHNLSGGGDPALYLAQLQALIPYLIENKIAIVTLSQWYWWCYSRVAAGTRSAATTRGSASGRISR